MTAGGDPVGSAVSPRGLTTRRLAVPMFVLVAVEFILGMVLALFSTLPTGSAAVALLSSNPVLDFHILVALLLVGISTRAVRTAVREPTRTPLFASALALASAVVATLAGGLFAFDGQSPVASFAMSVGFLGVVVGTLVLLGRGPGAESSLPRRVVEADRPEAGGVP